MKRSGGASGYCSVMKTVERQHTNKGGRNLDLEEPFDEDFWFKVEEKVATKAGITWKRAMDEVRTERLMARHGIDTLLVLIRDWPSSEKYENEPVLLASLEYLIRRFTVIVLERDTEEEYKYYRIEEEPARPTLLHLAAERNFVHITKLLVEKYPSLVYVGTEKVEGERGYFPVEKALVSYNDETAAFLLSRMKLSKVKELFLYDEDLEKAAKFNLGHFISHKNPETGKHDMRKTVTALLDLFVIPQWPYLPDKTQEPGEISDRIERAWSSVPEDALNYDFVYHVLEADDQGRQPKIDKHTVNEIFNMKSVSCLRQIAESGDKDAIQHPVVRMLVTRKWKTFGHWWFCVQAAFYVLYLFLLSFALVHGSTQDDPTQYRGKANGLRMICEILSILFLVFYICKEIDQLERVFALLSVVHAEIFTVVESTRTQKNA